MSSEAGSEPHRSDSDYWPLTPPPQPDTETPKSRAVARTVYLIPHLRNLIYPFLGQEELVTFMQVEKMCAEEIPKELYRVMYILHLLGNLVKCRSTRQEAHRSLVKTIDAQDISGHWHLYDLAIKSHLYSRRAPDSFDHYSLDGFKWIVPLLRERYPNLRTINLGPGPQSANRKVQAIYGDRWIVHCSDAKDTGRIEAKSTLERNAGLMNLHLSPPPGYTLTTRFDVRLGAMVDRHDNHYNRIPSPLLRVDYWRSALLDNARLAPLHHVAIFDQLPVSLGEIEQLIQRQIDAGYTDCLERIEGVQIDVWDVEDFRAFAKFASVSLKHLSLRSGGGEYNPEFCGVSAKDLPDIIAVVREHLPNLETLSFEMKDTADLEAACGRALWDGCLDSRGSIKRLEIFTDHPVSHPLNLTRLLFGVCARRAKIRVDHYSADAKGVNDNQTALMKRFQQLPLQNRRQIATVNYHTLGVTTTKHAYELAYRSSDGRPISLWEARSADWKARGRRVGRIAATLGPDLAKFEERSSRVHAMVLVGDKGEPAVKEARKLLAVLQRTKKAKDEVSKLLSYYAVEEQIKEYTELLEKLGG